MLPLGPHIVGFPLLNHPAAFYGTPQVGRNGFGTHDPHLFAISAPSSNKCQKFLVGGRLEADLLFFHANVIIPTDELIFFRGVGLSHQPDSVSDIMYLVAHPSKWVSSPQLCRWDK